MTTDKLNPLGLSADEVKAFRAVYRWLDTSIAANIHPELVPSITDEALTALAEKCQHAIQQYEAVRPSMDLIIQTAARMERQMSSAFGPRLGKD